MQSWALYTEKFYLLANLYFVCGTECDEATSPSFATENRSIDASRSLLEVPIATHQMRGDAYESSFTMAKKYLFVDLYCLRAERMMRQHHSLLQLKTGRLMLPTRCWKRQLQLIMCGGCEREQFAHSKQMLVCQSFILYSQRG